MLDFTLHERTAVLHFDDGKANALGHDLIDQISEGLARSRSEADVVVLAGRNGVFSAGFDLQEFKKGPEATMALVHRGGELLVRLFAHTQPVVAACTGHALAAGALLLLASDTRIGAEGEFKIGLNETAIGMSLPVFGLELAKARLTPRHLSAALTQATIYEPPGAIEAGFLDRAVAPEQVLEAALEEATELAKLPKGAYAANKLALRQPIIDVIRASLSS